MWKLHEIRDQGVYKDLRYNRIRFLEQRGGEPDLTPYPDPGEGPSCGHRDSLPDRCPLE